MDKTKCSQCSRMFLSSEDLEEHRLVKHPIFMSDADLAHIAKSAIYNYLTSNGMDAPTRDKAKIALGHISAEARREAARNNSIAMMIGAAAKMTHTTQEFQDLLKAALPDLPVIKALPANAGPHQNDDDDFDK